MKHKRLIVALLVSIVVLVVVKVSAQEPPKPVPTTPFEEASERVFSQTDDGLLTYADQVGKWFNIRDGQRVTVGQPDHYTRTVWMIGNSTMVGLEVADKDTLPSILQAMLPSCRFENLAFQSINVNAMRFRLKMGDVRPGDVALFMSGYLEANYQQMASEPFFGDVLKAKADTEALGATYLFILQPYGGHDKAVWDLYDTYTASLAQSPFAHDFSRVVTASDVWYVDIHLNEVGMKMLAEKVRPLIADFCE